LWHSCEFNLWENGCIKVIKPTKWFSLFWKSVSFKNASLADDFPSGNFCRRRILTPWRTRCPTTAGTSRTRLWSSGSGRPSTPWATRKRRTYWGSSPALTGSRLAAFLSSTLSLRGTAKTLTGTVVHFLPLYHQCGGTQLARRSIVLCR
jgi:hypothetical protein